MFDIIDRHELRRKLARGAGLVLIDTLPETAYRRSHLPGAINIRSDDIRAMAPGLIPDKTTPIVVYCASGPCQRSRRAAERLVDMGYSNVSDYHEGKRDWVEAGLPVEGTDD